MNVACRLQGGGQSEKDRKFGIIQNLIIVITIAATCRIYVPVV